MTKLTISNVEQSAGSSAIRELATKAYSAISDLPIEPEIKVSDLWQHNIQQYLNEAANGLNPEQLVCDVTNNDRFSYPRHRGQPGFYQQVLNYINWLEEHGFSLNSSNSLIQESQYASDNVVEILPNGKIVSTAFLYHLCIAHRVTSALGVNEMRGGGGRQYSR